MPTNTPISKDSLTVTIPKINNAIPSEGPKAVPVRLDFTGAISSYELDGTLLEQLRLLSMIQAIYIDLSNNPNSLTVTVENGGQVIQAKGNTQGYYPILCPNPFKLIFTGSPNTKIVPVYLCNIPLAGVVWPTQ